jgi:hypothetical protein
MRRTTAVAAALALTVAGVAGGSAAHAADGVGSVTDTIVGTTVAGLLTIAGTGVQVGVSGAPGQLTSTVGATALTVSDLTGGDAGWAVTATYGAPTAGSAIPAADVLVSASDVTGDIAGTALSLAVDAPLTSPVTLATTGTAAGTGVTVLTAGYKVRLPATAQVGEVYGAKVTYTVATVR